MSETQHTPGPWWPEGDTRQGSEQNFHIESKSATICFCSTGHPDDDVALANAQLVAAAPNLLAACEKLVETIRNGTVYEVFEPSYYNGSIVRLFFDVENASAAIAKAKGVPDAS